ncbi:MAG: CusA/CzcA family heavy metal efflux RND transporter [Muribaculaceae bacterium]|nr:CusA/CzcA family heavy metal efflux RND transporter [Muribaculaceae bacterium]
MLNAIIHSSLRNRLAVVIITALVLIAGVLALTRMEVDIFPDLNAPTVVVMTEAPGFAPDEVEKVVSYPIETAVNGSAGVRRVRSTSNTGFSVVWVEFDWDMDIYRARQIVSERLDAVAENLPEGVGKPVMGPQSSILGEMMIVGFTADSTSLDEVRRRVETIVKPRLLAVGGVSQVSVIGGDAPEYQVKLDPGRMAALGVSLDEAAEALDGFNANAGGGVIYEYGNEYIVKADINSADPEALALATVRSDERGTVTVGDIATVVLGGRRPRIGLASVNTDPAVIVTVTKQPGHGTLGLTETVDATLRDLMPSLPADVHIETDIFRQADFIDNSISNLQRSLLEGALFVIIVLFFFLMNLRTTLISVVALPLSIIVSVLILNALGYTINTMSLGGIAIAIGCLVDDAIVDVENVYKRLRQNAALPAGERQSVLDCVYHASAEVRMPIFNSTLIITAAFLPLFFLTGMEGRMLKPLGVAFIISLAASTIVALTVTPVLCSWLLGSRKANKEMSAEPRITRWLRGIYTRSLAVVLRHGRALIITVLVLLAGALAVFFSMGRGFLPGFNEGSFTINVSTLPGISLEESDAIGREAERIIMATPEVRNVARKTGRAELDEHSFGANVSEIEAPYTLAGRSRSEVLADLRSRFKTIPGAIIEIGQPISHRIDAMLSGSSSQIAIKIFGPDLNTLFSIGRNVREIVSGVDGAVDVNIEQQVERPELVISPRREVLAAKGIRMGDFSRAISTALGGRIVGQVYRDGYAYDINMILDDAWRERMDDIAALTIDSPSGKVALAELADIRSTTGPNTVNRENVERRLLVSANVSDRDIRSTVDEIRRRVASEVDLPAGYHVQYGGQFESEEAASRTLLWASLGALLLIFMLLYGEFRSAAQSLVILVNMPLALIGGILLLWICGGEVNIPAIIGFISLMGISTRNGMLLMTRYNRLKADGIGLSDRVLAGSDDRLLPIIMTALTSALALIPLALKADAPGNEIQAPMAIVILGGLLSSTLLNIYVVPVLYTYLCRREMTHTNKLANE